ncbi:MAG: hypothetical protein AWU54_2138 [Candidatus Frackibacter sp. T328-2]|nr:MAG: hypothetical protein AWU54_2138 [Candidatus Frackibacter sp. T328-2]
MSNKIYDDKMENKYTKDDKGGLAIKYLDQNGNTETLYIPNFQEGDYGLWIEQDAPYRLEGNSIINNATGDKAPQDKVLAKEENKWLKEEERIKDNFLWVYPNEEIVWPEVEDKEESGEETDENKQKEQTEAVAISSAEVAATKEDTTQSQKATKNNENRGSTQARLYVCDGAKLQCNQGDKKSTFKVIDIHNVYIQGKPMATIQDSKPMVNIKPFGKCKSMANPTVAAATAANHGNLKKMPCQPNIPGLWQGGKDDVTITSIPTVLETSKLNCAYAGVIKVVDPGQDLVSE